MERLTNKSPLAESQAMNLSLTDLYMRLKIYEDAEEEGRLMVLDCETALAIAAGWRAIRTTKKFQGATYVYDPFGKGGGPYEITYAKAVEILRAIWDKFPLEAEKALEAKA